jgi:hypothetical protein
MASKIESEANRYKAQLKATLKDGKVTTAEADALVKDAKKAGFTEVKAFYLTGFQDRNGDKFEAKGRADLQKFVTGDLAKATIEGETGLTPKAGQPKLTSADTRSKDVTYKAETGSITHISGDDPLQGAVGDCYFVSSLSAVAQNHPELIKNNIKANADGTYTVTFFERADMGKPATPVKITVDGAMPTKAGQLEYISSRDAGDVWPQIYEKAYAAWKGGYGAIEGGMGANALEALTGAKPGFAPDADPAATFAQLKAACAQKGCVVALSQPYGSDVKGVISDHAYTVLGTSEKDGKQFVQLRNPWGQSEPGSDGKDDGIFTLPVEQFIKAYAAIEFVRP